MEACGLVGREGFSSQNPIRERLMPITIGIFNAGAAYKCIFPLVKGNRNKQGFQFGAVHEHFTTVSHLITHVKRSNVKLFKIGTAMKHFIEVITILGTERTHVEAGQP